LDAGESATKKSPDRKPYKQTETESRVAREVSPGARAPPSNEGFDGELGNPKGRREQYLRRRRADEGEEGGATGLGFEREIVPSCSNFFFFEGSLLFDYVACSVGWALLVIGMGYWAGHALLQPRVA